VPLIALGGAVSNQREVVRLARTISIPVCRNSRSKAIALLSDCELRTGEQKVWHQANVALTIRPSKLALINILDIPLQLPGSISGVSQHANVMQL
jgi:hypothetical protein